MQNAIVTRDTACAQDYTYVLKNGEIIRILPTRLISAISRDRWYMIPIETAFSLGPKVGISDPERGAF